MFTPVKIPMAKIAPLSLAFCGFVIFNNLSLQYNPVGVYQVIFSFDKYSAVSQVVLLRSLGLNMFMAISSQ